MTIPVTQTNPQSHTRREINQSVFTKIFVSENQPLASEFADQWEALYPAMIKSWRDTWEDFIPFLEFPVELRKIVYSTDVIVNQLPRVYGAASEPRVLHRPFLLARSRPSQHLAVL